MPETDRGNTTAQPEQWDLPATFYEHDLPPFPVSSLPSWQRDLVQGLAHETQTPLDLSAMVTLTVCAGAVARRVRIQARPGWNEPLNIYTAVAMNPANRKSAVFAEACEPLEEVERELIEETRDEIAQAASEYRMLEQRRDRIEKEAARSDDPEERKSKQAEAIHHAQELATRRVPVAPRLIAADVTPETLASLLAEQGGRMCLLSAEGGLFDILAGRYTGGAPNFEVILKGHSGDELRVDRRGRAEHVPLPALTIGLTVQPDVIRGLVDKPGFHGRGLIGRFLYSLPKSTVGRRLIAPQPLENSVRYTYKNNIKALARLRPTIDPNGLPFARMLYLTADADSLLKKFEAELEPLLAEDAELGTMADWAGKLAGAVVRIVGILHLADRAQSLDPWPERVSAETMSRAIAIGRYLIPHAKAAYAEIGADPQLENAKRLLRWIRRTAQPSFSKRDAYQAHKGRFKKVAEIEPPLKVLHEQGYIRPHTDNPDHGPGRKPSEVFDVNPFYLSVSQCS
jgi:transcription elongation GreA/GreB family factor